MALKNLVDVTLVFQADMKTFGVDVDVRKSLTSFPNNRSIHVRIYKLELVRPILRDVEYLNIRHEQFVEQVHIGLAKICKILVSEKVNSQD
jgi:hypothetical protein